MPGQGITKVTSAECHAEAAPQMKAGHSALSSLAKTSQLMVREHIHHTPLKLPVSVSFTPLGEYMYH